jgi:hypothetical protein
MLEQKHIKNIFVGIDVNKIQTKPASAKNPPQFDIIIRPTVRISNNTFSFMRLYRQTDNRLIESIQPGGYIYMYESIRQEVIEDDNELEEHDLSEQLKESKKKAGCCKKPRKVMLYQQGIEGSVIRINKYYWTFEDDGKLMYKSQPDFLYSFTTKTKFICQSKLQGNYELTKNIEEPIEHSIYLTFEVEKFNVFIYTPFMLINQSNADIFFGEKAIKDQDLLLICNHKSEYFNPLTTDKKAYKFKVEKYEWSKTFDISVVGITSVLNLQRSKALLEDEEKQPINQPYIAKHNASCLTFGVRTYRLEYPFSKTIAVNLKPRYIFCNYCADPVIFTQDSENASLQYWLKPDDRTTFHFEDWNEEDNFVKFRQPQPKEYEVNGLIPIKDVDDITWSRRFKIDDLEDFQIALQSNEEDVRNLPTGPRMKNHKKRWSEPQDSNLYRRFVRVIITTSDDTTLFIMLFDPNMPEFKVINHAPVELKFSIRDDKQRKIGGV